MNGQELRDEGLERAGSGAAAVALAIWHDKALNAIVALSHAEADFSADDVRRAAGEPPSPNCMGAAFREAYAKGWIVPSGYGQATRPERHASIQRFWRGK